MKTTFGLSLAVVVLSVGSALDVSAQGRPNAAARGRGGDPAANVASMEVLNMLDAYAVLQAQKTVELTDAQYAEFVARLKRLQQTRRRSQQARNAIILELRRLTAPKVQQLDENAIRERLRALRELDERAGAELRQAYDQLDEILSARQQARFRIFEETLERRKLDLLMRARRGGTGQ
jgi:hypothetical protein